MIFALSVLRAAIIFFSFNLQNIAQNLLNLDIAKSRIVIMKSHFDEQRSVF